ncbi:hypothetical protein FisN_26Hh036 [Fistulifera solaris]|uniref:Uncharacterized protein n=1 Tax=Fistulifera solaris TaxID=1519565 RepID=A0A1Z5JXK2_FISSO|nr:hypothetical protein FisN_26Hh036 [Fistulifera solaris]|eukprot:GAX18743.1 hypothetical protein FisN_26Hh036 [Fistulifera solaris]
MVNFLGGPRTSHMRAMHWTASNDSGASLDADPTKMARPNLAQRKQLSSPRAWTERNAKSRKTTVVKREEKEPPPKAAASLPKRAPSRVQPDTRIATPGSVTTNVQRDDNDDIVIDAPPLRSPKARPQVSTNIQCEVVDQPLSPKSPNMVTSSKTVLKSGKKEKSFSAVVSPTGTVQRDKEPVFFQSKKGVDDKTAMSSEPIATKGKAKKKGLFSRFGGRRERDEKSTPAIKSAPKEIVHEIIANDTRRVSMSPIVVTVDGSQLQQKGELKVDQSTTTKVDDSDIPQDRAEKGFSNFVDSLTSFARLPTSNLSRTAKKHGSFLLEVFHSEHVVSPRATSTKPTITTELLVADHTRQTLSPVDPARQKQWIVSVIEAIHRARRITTTPDYESMMDSEDSDIVDGPRVMYSGDLDDASVSSIEVLFHWMTCNMDRVYAVPNKDHRGTVISGDDFSQMEDDESTEGSLEY